MGLLVSGLSFRNLYVASIQLDRLRAILDCAPAGFRVKGLGFRALGSGLVFRAYGSQVRVEGSGYRVCGFKV